jgi:signal peptidase I
MTEEPNKSGNAYEASKQEFKREVKEFTKMIAWFLILFLVMKAYVIEGYEVQGPSMQPTLANDDRILVFKLPHELSQFSLFSWMNAINPGDIVVFKSPEDPGKRYVKRVIAEGPVQTPENTASAHGAGSGPERERAVSVRIQDGRVFVNNQSVSEPYLQGTSAKYTGGNTDVRIGAGEFFVMGDNREVSKDSRSFRGVHQSAIIGKAVLRFWPLGKFGLVR